MGFWDSQNIDAMDAKEKLISRFETTMHMTEEVWEKQIKHKKIDMQKRLTNVAQEIRRMEGRCVAI